MNIIFWINIIASIFYTHGKNIVLNFQRLTFDKLTGKSSIIDYISYDIYTYLYMGTPLQKVFHYIQPHEGVYQFKKQDIKYNNNKFRDSIIDSQKNIINYFNPENSLSYNVSESFSENFLFNIYNSTNTIEVKDLKFTIYLNNRNDKEINGRIGLFTLDSDYDYYSYFNDRTSFIIQLNDKGIIDKKVFSFIYDNNADCFNSSKEEKIIIGEYSYNHSQKININEQEKIYSYTNKHWSFLINEIKFNYSNNSFLEEQKEVKFNFFSKFIKGSVEFKENVEKSFFDQLIKLKLCKKELISENRESYEYEIYYCNNTKLVNKHIKSFPKLDFIQKHKGLVFSFTYKDLFKQFDNKIYFMIIFRFYKYATSTSVWEVGEIFMRKFIIDFDLESRSIIFYKNQVNEASHYINENFDRHSKNGFNTNSIIRTVVETVMGIIIVFCFYLLYRKYRKSRKILANELEDNYVYIDKENVNKKQLIDEQN